MSAVLVLRRSLQKAVFGLLIGVALGASGLAALADSSRSGHAPDPPARASHKQWMVEVVAQAGKVAPGQATAVTLEKPAESPRVMGRFALELYVGPELLDRVRFNLPLLDPPKDKDMERKGALSRPSFDQVTTRLKVRIADNPRASYLLLVDRATGETQRFAWPPDAGGHLLPWKTGSLSDAGPGDAQGGGIKVAEVKEDGAADGGTSKGPKKPGPPEDAGRD